jgi:transposase
LGLTAPWTVAGVDEDMTGQRVVVRVTAGPRYDSKPRRWRRLDTMQFAMSIEADGPRMACGPHGAKQVPVPWAEPGSQFITLFERLAIDMLREWPVSGAVDLLRISWGEGWGIKVRAVTRGRARRSQEVADRTEVDEEGIAKRHRYQTMVADLGQSRVLCLADDRKHDSLDGSWPTLAFAQRDGTIAGAMVMWKRDVPSTRTHLPWVDGEIVFEKFHGVMHLHDAVDHVQREGQRALEGAGDARLTGSEDLWPRRPEDLSNELRAPFRALQRKDLDVGRAWALKERFRPFWERRHPGAVRTFVTRWFWRVTRSRIKPMAAAAKLIQRHRPNLLSRLTHRVINAGLDGVNAVVQWVKKTARGFRNAEHFKTAIYGHCGGLDLYQRETH